MITRTTVVMLVNCNDYGDELGGNEEATYFSVAVIIISSNIFVFRKVIPICSILLWILARKVLVSKANGSAHHLS